MKTFFKFCLLGTVLASHAFAANEMNTAKKTVNKAKENFSLNSQQRACIENKIGSVDHSTVTQAVKDQAYRDCGINLAQRKPHMRNDYIKDDVNVQKSSTQRNNDEWRDTTKEKVPTVTPTNR